MTTYATPYVVVSPPARGSAAAGTLLALLAVPLGVVAWVVIWSFGFIAGIVTFGVAVAATWLYRKGSRSAMTAEGAFIVVIMVLTTLVLGLVAGLGVDYVRAIGEQNGLTWTEVVNYPQFWQLFGQDLPALVTANTSNILIALAFAAVGCIAALRAAFKRDAPATPGVSSSTGPVPTQASLYGPISPAKEMPQLPEEQWISYRPPVDEQPAPAIAQAARVAQVARVAQAPRIAPAPAASQVPAAAPAVPAAPARSAQATAVLTGPIPVVETPVAPAPAQVQVPVTTSFAPPPVEDAPKAPRHRQD